MIIFNYVCSLVVTGFITFLFIEICGYDMLIYGFACLGTLGLGLLFTWDDEELDHH